MYIYQELVIARDELCGSGTTLQSRALEFSEAEFNKQLQQLQSQRGSDQDNELLGEDEDSKVSVCRFIFMLSFS